MTARAPGTRRNPPLSPESRGQSETPPARGGVSSFRFSLSGSRRTLFAERRLPYVQGTTFTRFRFELSAAWEESGCQFGLTVRAVASRSSEALNYARRSLFHDEPPLAVYRLFRASRSLPLSPLALQFSSRILRLSTLGLGTQKVLILQYATCCSRHWRSASLHGSKRMISGRA